MIANIVYGLLFIVLFVWVWMVARGKADDVDAYDSLVQIGEADIANGAGMAKLYDRRADIISLTNFKAAGKPTEANKGFVEVMTDVNYLGISKRLIEVGATADPDGKYASLDGTMKFLVKSAMRASDSLKYRIVQVENKGTTTAMMYQNISDLLGFLSENGKGGPFIAVGYFGVDNLDRFDLPKHLHACDRTRNGIIVSKELYARLEIKTDLLPVGSSMHNCLFHVKLYHKGMVKRAEDTTEDAIQKMLVAMEESEQTLKATKDDVGKIMENLVKYSNNRVSTLPP